jgi:hypothetical protein
MVKARRSEAEPRGAAASQTHEPSRVQREPQQDHACRLGNRLRTPAPPAQVHLRPVLLTDALQEPQHRLFGAHAELDDVRMADPSSPPQQSYPSTSVAITTRRVTVTATRQRSRCSVPDCSSPVSCRQLCNAHYKRPRPGPPCSVRGCVRRSDAFGRSGPHRHDVRRHIRPMRKPADRVRPGGRLVIDHDATSPARTRGFNETGPSSSHGRHHQILHTIAP